MRDRPSVRRAAAPKTHPLRSSIATRLLAGGLAFTAVLIAGISGFLLISRNQQTDAGALSNADNRAGVAAQLLARVTEPQAQYAAANLASLGSMQMALASSAPATAVAQEFAGKQAVTVPGLAVVIFDAHGTVLYSTECDATDSGGIAQHPSTAQCEAAVAAHLTASAPSVQGALTLAGRDTCRLVAAGRVTDAATCPAGVEGTEMLAAGAPAFDVAVPVRNALDGSYAPLGVVVYSAPLRTQFQRFGPVIGFTPVFYAGPTQPTVVRFVGSTNVPTVSVAPAQVAAQTTGRSAIPADGVAARAIYAVPGLGDVAGSFVALGAPGGQRVAGFLGVEVPLSVFAAATAQDERTIAEIAVTAMVVVSLLVLLFVDHFVRRPVSTLERGVSRIAGGDYTTDVPVTSEDELGRLARSVNSMREQIAGYVRHIDGSIERLQDVSRALTTTTGGVDDLQDAVLRAAAATAGSRATSMLLTRRGDDLVVTRIHGEVPERGLGSDTIASILAGNAARRDREGRHVLVVPIMYQGAVTGALVTVTEEAVFESDQRTLETLANNSAVALANTRLFEQEKNTVQRLSELNQMKSDFLGTAQHELRTPVLAIQGQIELLTRAWTTWDDDAKVDLVRDIEISTHMLGELLETIVDFSLLSSDTLDLRPTPVSVVEIAREAAGDVGGHFKGALPVSVTHDISADAVVVADPARFRKVVRALLDNAVKFTPEGGHVIVRARPEFATGRCRIEIIDDGIGIAPDALPRVFDRFFQEDNSRTRKYGGMGMGLALVRRLCEAHSATITVQSEPGAGTTVTMLWPVAIVPQRTARTSNRSRSAAQPAAEAAPLP